MPRQFRTSTRGSSVLLGSVLLVGLVVVVAAGVGAAAFDVADSSPSPTRPTALSLSVSGDTLSLVHEGGAPLDVDSLVVRISVDGAPLAHQPPVPFFSAAGYDPGPTGAFNSASDGVFEPGERARLSLAATNAPHFDPGDRVTVRIHRADTTVATASVRAG